MYRQKNGAVPTECNTQYIFDTDIQQLLSMKENRKT